MQRWQTLKSPQTISENFVDDIARLLVNTHCNCVGTYPETHIKCNDTAKYFSTKKYTLQTHEFIFSNTEFIIVGNVTLRVRRFHQLVELRAVVQCQIEKFPHVIDAPTKLTNPSNLFENGDDWEIFYQKTCSTYNTVHLVGLVGRLKMLIVLYCVTTHLNIFPRVIN